MAMQKDKKHLLTIKKAKKAQQPAFLRRNFMKNKRTRVSGSWRAPKGLHNKLRRRRRGIGQWVMPGYRMPRAVRGLTVTGYRPLLVENVRQLEKLDASHDLVVIKKGTGAKKRLAIVKYAQEKKFFIQSINDLSAYIANLEKKHAEKKKLKTTMQPDKKVTVKGEEKKEEEKKEEEKKEEEKKELQKVLTKKE